MSFTPSEAAWMLVRKAPTLTDQDITNATGIHPVELVAMRQRHVSMQANGIQSRQDWHLDQLPLIVRK